MCLFVFGSEISRVEARFASLGETCQVTEIEILFDQDEINWKRVSKFISLFTSVVRVTLHKKYDFAYPIVFVRVLRALPHLRCLKLDSDFPSNNSRSLGSLFPKKEVEEDDAEDEKDQEEEEEEEEDEKGVKKEKEENGKDAWKNRKAALKKKHEKEIEKKAEYWPRLDTIICKCSLRLLTDLWIHDKIVSNKLKTLKVRRVEGEIDLSPFFRALQRFDVTIDGGECTESPFRNSASMRHLIYPTQRTDMRDSVSVGRVSTVILTMQTEFSREIANLFNVTLSSRACNVKRIDLTRCNLSDGTLRRVSIVIAKHRQCTDLALGGSITMRGLAYFARKCLALKRDNFRKLEFCYFVRQHPLHCFADVCRLFDANERLEVLSLDVLWPFNSDYVSRENANEIRVDASALSELDGTLLISTISRATHLHRLSLDRVCDGSCDFFVRVARALPARVQRFDVGFSSHNACSVLDVCRILAREKWNLRKLLITDNPMLHRINSEWTQVVSMRHQLQRVIKRSISLQQVHLSHYPVDRFKRSTMQRFTSYNVIPILVLIFSAIAPLDVPCYIAIDIVNQLSCEFCLVSSVLKLRIADSTRRKYVEKSTNCT